MAEVEYCSLTPPNANLHACDEHRGSVGLVAAAPIATIVAQYNSVRQSSINSAALDSGLQTVLSLNKE